MTQPPLPLTRGEAAARILAAKRSLGTTWRQLAGEIGQSVVWTTSALLGQQPMTAVQATSAVAVLGLGQDVHTALQLPAVRTADAVDGSDPLVYRLGEAIQVYGAAVKALVEEEFGDGIVSAIDFTMGFERVADPKGDRVRLTFEGKFLPYNVF